MTIIEEHHGQRIKCDSCKSILEYLSEDEHPVEGNFHRIDKYVVCPVCQHKIYTVIN